MNSDIMTVEDTAKYLNMHKMSVYKHFRDKKLPCFKIGGRWRTKKDLLDNFLLGEWEKRVAV